MLSCAGRFAQLYFPHGRAPPLLADVREIPDRRRPARQAMLATARPAAREVPVARRLPQVEPGKQAADRGCGAGRQLNALSDQRHPHPLGVDRSALLLAEARSRAPAARLVRADLRALPLHAASLAAAFCFY